MIKIPQSKNWQEDTALRRYQMIAPLLDESPLSSLNSGFALSIPHASPIVKSEALSNVLNGHW